MIKTGTGGQEVWGTEGAEDGKQMETMRRGIDMMRSESFVVYITFCSLFFDFFLLFFTLVPLLLISCSTLISPLLI